MQLIEVASRAFDLGKWSAVTRLKGGILNELTSCVDIVHKHLAGNMC